MLKDRVRYAVMEISSHSLDQDRAGRISFDIGIFTNITRDHLDYHKTIRNYFKAKAKLFKKLKPGGTAILNNDDSMVSGLKRRIKNKALTYGIDNASDVMAQDVKLSISSSSFTVKTLKGSFGIRTSLIGKHNVSNILAGTACAIALGMPLGTIKRGIELFRSVPGRLELIDYDIGFKVFVDYAHTHDALYNVLALLKGVTREGRIITVFGCGGNRDRTKRPLMGEVACKLSDRVVITSDNPRLEDPAKIISHIEAGIKGRYSNYDIVEDRRCAIGRALEIAGKGDIVIIAGKGHEKYQIIKDKNIPFDDREVAASILKTMPCR